jgi:hypothetical protein
MAAFPPDASGHFPLFSSRAHPPMANGGWRKGHHPDVKLYRKGINIKSNNKTQSAKERAKSGIQEVLPGGLAPMRIQLPHTLRRP